jgi:hypothetical protein
LEDSSTDDYDIFCEPDQFIVLDDKNRLIDKDLDKNKHGDKSQDKNSSECETDTGGSAKNTEDFE